MEKQRSLLKGNQDISNIPNDEQMIVYKTSLIIYYKTLLCLILLYNY